MWQQWLLAAVGVVVAVFVLRFVIAWLNEAETAGGSTRDDVVEALDRTTTWFAIIIAGFLGAVATGLVQFADLLDMVTMGIASHPFAVSNLGAIGLGAIGLSGLFQLTVSQYVGIALGIVGLTLFITEARD